MFIIVRNVSHREHYIGNQSVKPGEFAKFDDSLKDYFVTNEWEIIRFEDDVKRIPIIKGFPTIVVVAENFDYYSGGRYYLMELATCLSEMGCKVHYLTNKVPMFVNDFSDYNTSKIHFEIDEHLQCSLKTADCVISAPIDTAAVGVSMARAFNCPSICVVFETPNWIAKFERDERKYLTNIAGVKLFREALVECDGIIAISNECLTNICEWDKRISAEKISIINPAINNRVADKCETLINKAGVVFVGRIAFNKRFQLLYDTIMKIDNVFDFHVITTNIEKREMELLVGNSNHKIVWHVGVSDLEKFSIINSCKVLAMPSSFEGYGMPPQEAMYLGTNVVVSNLPIFKEVYDNKVLTFDLMKPEELKTQIVNALELPIKYDKSYPTMVSMTNQLYNVPEIPYKYRTLSDIYVVFVIYNFNNVDNLVTCLDSIYEYANEIILINNDSIRVHKIVTEYCDKDNKIKYFSDDITDPRSFAVSQINRTKINDGVAVLWELDSSTTYTNNDIATTINKVFKNPACHTFIPLTVYKTDAPKHLSPTLPLESLNHKVTVLDIACEGILNG